MSNAYQNMLIMKGVLAEMPDETQAKVKAAAELIREIVKTTGDEGPFALALVASELAASVGE